MWIEPFHTPAKWLILSALLSANIANSLWGWTPTVVASHLWTIGVEEQFYLFWPLMVQRNRPRGLVTAALGMLAISFVARTICWLTNAPGSVVWTNTLTRLDPLAVGILLAVWMMHKQYHPRPLVRLLLLMSGRGDDAGCIGILRSVLEPQFGATLFFGYPAVALGCLAILLAFRGLRLRQNRSFTRAGIYLGKISYGLYIWQMMALVLIVKGVDRPLPFVGDWVYSSTFDDDLRVRPDGRDRRGVISVPGDAVPEAKVPLCLDPVAPGIAGAGYASVTWLTSAVG